MPVPQKHPYHIIGVMVLLFWCCLSTTGCYPPCQELRQQVCTTFQKTPGLCHFFKQELTKKRPTLRHCRALLDSFPTQGKPALMALEKKYLRYRRYVSKVYRSKRAQNRLQKAEVRIRQWFSALLQPPSPPTKKPVPRPGS